MMEVIENPKREQWPLFTKRPTVSFEEQLPFIETLFKKVQNEGDSALIEYTSKFDGVVRTELKASEQEIVLAESKLDSELKNAIAVAKSNIEAFHKAQRTRPVELETQPGVWCASKKVPIERVGIYIPGGSAPLFSTVLMLAIPAVIAGVDRIILCTPPDKMGEIHPAILYTAKLCGVTELYAVGGAQAIAALTFGTTSIPKVDKIFGPGNQYVTAAKQYASQRGVAIDMPAGPSELLVFADQSAVPQFVAADLLSQAEHGPDSQVVLVCTDQVILSKITSEIYAQLEQLPRKAIAEKALNNSRILYFSDRKRAAEFINSYAPEHYIIASEAPEDMVLEVRNAGSVFIGNYTPESAGDYASGTNHTLPTNGFARQYSGVNLDSYFKSITFQRISENGMLNLGPSVAIMAQAEQLEAHKNAVTVRLEYLKRNKVASNAYDISKQIRGHLRSSSVYSAARDEFSSVFDQYLWLDANENPFPNGANRYPDPYQTALKQRLSELWSVSKEELFIGNGSDEVLDLLMQLLVEPMQHDVVTFAPSYGMYQVLAEKNGIELSSVRLQEDFSLDWNLLEQTVSSRTKLVLLCSPNNPTGNALDADELISFLQKTNSLVVVDEAYIDFSKEKTLTNRVLEFPNLVVVRTLSKAYGLAGARLGVAVANPSIAGWLNKIKPPYNVSETSLEKAISRLADFTVIQREIEQIINERIRIERALETCKWVKKVYPSEANFILVRVDDAASRYQQLLDSHVVVRNRSSQLGCENTLRISVGTPDENDQLIKNLN